MPANQTGFYRRCQNRCGFTLTELAIVLGVIGILLGAIWTAAAMISQNQKLAKAQAEILTVASNIQSFARLRGSFANATYMNDITLALKNAGVFPTEMIMPGIDYPQTPWGGSAQVFSTPNLDIGTSMTTDSSMFEICLNIHTVYTQKTCPALIGKMVTSVSPDLLIAVFAGSSSGNSYTGTWLSTQTNNLDVTNPTIAACTYPCFAFSVT